MPGFSEKIVVCLSASAFTSWRYTSNYRGAMLGWEMSPEQFGERRPGIRGPLQNLYLTGHWTQPGGGITMVIISAMRVAEILRGRREAAVPVPVSRRDFQAW
jgi:prolycopene isomerase